MVFTKPDFNVFRNQARVMNIILCGPDRKIKLKKDCLWKQRTQNHENRRIDWIESLQHLQHLLCEATYAESF